MMVCSSGFKIPEEMVKKSKVSDSNKEESKRTMTEKELEERRMRIINDLEISTEGVHEKHFEQM